MRLSVRIVAIESQPDVPPPRREPRLFGILPIAPSFFEQLHLEVQLSDMYDVDFVLWSMPPFEVGLVYIFLNGAEIELFLRFKSGHNAPTWRLPGRFFDMCLVCTLYGFTRAYASFYQRWF